MMQDLSISNQTHSRFSSNLTDIRSQRPRSASFGQLLQQSINQVNRLQVEADSNINDLASGKQTDIHQTMIALEKADVAFQLQCLFFSCLRKFLLEGIFLSAITSLFPFVAAFPLS